MAGRRKGSLNKATVEVREAAQAYGPKALEILWQIAQTGKVEAARVSAAKELLERAYGKSPQALEVAGAAGGEIVIRHVYETQESA